jgi:hypothetical protein
MPRPPTTYQFDLFSSQRNAKPVQTPQWQALPAETRRSVTKLMISLILMEENCATIWMRIWCRGGGDDRGNDCRAQVLFSV